MENSFSNKERERGSKHPPVQNIYMKMMMRTINPNTIRLMKFNKHTRRQTDEKKKQSEIE